MNIILPFLALVLAPTMAYRCPRHVEPKLDFDIGQVRRFATEKFLILLLIRNPVCWKLVSTRKKRAWKHWTAWPMRPDSVHSFWCVRVPTSDASQDVIGDFFLLGDSAMSMSTIEVANGASRKHCSMAQCDPELPSNCILSLEGSSEGSSCWCWLHVVNFSRWQHGPVHDPGHRLRKLGSCLLLR